MLFLQIIALTIGGLGILFILLFAINSLTENKDQKEDVENLKGEPLANHLDYFNIKKNVVYFEDGTFALFFKMGQIYDDVKNNEQLNGINDNIGSLFLNRFKKDYDYKIFFRKHRNFEKDKKEHLKLNKFDNPLINDVYKADVEQIEKDAKNKLIFKYENYLVVKGEKDLDIDNLKSALYKEEITNKDFEKKVNDFEKELQDIENDLLPGLESLKLEPRKTTRQETIDIIDSYVNQEVTYNNNFNSKRNLFRTEIEVEEEYLDFGNKYGRFITFIDIPQKSRPTMFKLITNANQDMDISIDIKKLDSTNFKDTIEDKKDKLGNDKVKMNGNIDESKAQDERKLKKLLKALENNKEQYYRFEIKILIKSESIEELDKGTKEIINLIQAMNGATGYVEDKNNFKLFKETAPGMESLFNNFVDYDVISSYLANMLPFYGAFKGVGKAMMLFRSRLNSIIKFNPFNDLFDAKNGIIVGKTGGGKSFTMIQILLMYLGLDPIITIVDKGGSFKKLVQILGGSYFQVTEENEETKEVSVNYGINPFYVTSSKKYAVWKSVLEQMIKEEGSHITNNQKTIIDRAINLVKKEIEKGEFEFPIVEDFIEAVGNLEFPEHEDYILKEVRDQTRIDLKRWVDNEFYNEFLNNREPDFDPNSDIICFDLDGLDQYEELLKIFMLYISDVAWNKTTGNRDRAKVFIFDEMWKVLKNDIGGKLVVEMYRTLRKLGASIFTLSQDIADVAESKYAKGILKNTSFTYVMQQKGNLDLLQETLNLSDRNIEQIRNLKVNNGEWAEAFLTLEPEARNFVARIRPSSLAYWIATTSSKDKSIYHKTKKAFRGDKRKALNFLANKCPRGYGTYGGTYDNALDSFDGDIIKTFDYLYENVLPDELKTNIDFKEVA